MLLFLAENRDLEKHENLQIIFFLQQKGELISSQNQRVIQHKLKFYK